MIWPIGLNVSLCEALSLSLRDEYRLRMRSEVPTVVVCDETPCSLVEVYWCLERVLCLMLTCLTFRYLEVVRNSETSTTLHAVKSQKTIFRLCWGSFRIMKKAKLSLGWVDSFTALPFHPSGTNWIGGWVGFWAGLDNIEGKKKSYPYRELNLDSSMVHPVASSLYWMS
jgi:hypothetical protein